MLIRNILKSVGLLLGIVMVVAITTVIVIPMASFSAAPSGLHSIQMFATTTTIGTMVTKVFASNSVCASRIIRTQAQPIVITFGDAVNSDATGNLAASSSLSFVAGFAQAASTTIAYDSGLYGCGDWYGYALASTSVSLASFK